MLNYVAKLLNFDYCAAVIKATLFLRSVFLIFSYCSQCKQKDIQNQRETGMALLWEENGGRAFRVYQNTFNGGS